MLFAFFQEPPGQVRSPKPNGQIEKKDPAPADGIDDEAAEGGTGEKADMKCHGNQSHGFTPFVGRHGDGSDGSAVGRDHRPAHRLEGAKKNDLGRRLRHAAKRRAQNEKQKPRGVKTAPPEQITETADGDDQADQGKIINQQYPLNGRQTGMKSMGQCRQCDQQGALVQSNNELTDADIEQNERGAPLIRDVDLRSGVHVCRRVRRVNVSINSY